MQTPNESSSTNPSNPPNDAENQLNSSSNQDKDSASKALISTQDLPLYQQYLPAPAPAKILEEDDYVEAMSKIVQRQFFPDLERMKLQSQFMDAVNSGDFVKASQLKVQLEQESSSNSRASNCQI